MKVKCVTDGGIECFVVKGKVYEFYNSIYDPVKIKSDTDRTNVYNKYHLTVIPNTNRGVRVNEWIRSY